MTEAEIKEKLKDSREEILVLHKSVMMAKYGTTELPARMPESVKKRYVAWENRLIVHNVAIYKVLEVNGYRILDNEKVVKLDDNQLLHPEEQQLLFIKGINIELLSETAPPELKTQQDIDSYILEGQDMISYSNEIIAQLHLLGYQICKK